MNVVGGVVSVAAAEVAAGLIRHPQRFPLRGLPAGWWLSGNARSIDTPRIPKMCNPRAAAQGVCEHTSELSGALSSFYWQNFSSLVDKLHSYRVVTLFRLCAGI